MIRISRADLSSLESAGYRTGGAPSEASVIANEWFDRRSIDANDISARQWARCLAAVRKGVNLRNPHRSAS